MKRIIIISMMLLSIYCSSDSCIAEKDLSQCSKHTMEPELNFLSCFKYMSPDNQASCGSFFTDPEAQKTYIKYLVGYQKEQASKYPLSKIEEENTPIIMFDKESYDKDDTITTKFATLTEEEKKIINNNNTCYHKAFARFVEAKHNLGENKVNVTDKNFCFNAEKFKDLEGIMDCGYATIKGKINNVSFAFTNCFNILDKNVDETFKKHFYYSAKQTNLFQSYHLDIVRNNITNIYTNKEDSSKLENEQFQSQLLQSQDIQDFHMVVEDKNGNVVSYNKSEKWNCR